MAAHVEVTLPCLRFPDLNDVELDNIVDSKDASSTKRIVRNAVETLITYCTSKQLNISDIKEYSSGNLNTFLRRFYAEVGTAKGNFYAKKSMQVLRFGLQRNFHKLCKIDIIKDRAFDDANIMFQSMLVKLKNEGKGAVRHIEPIQIEDMEKIQNTLDQKTPLGLQNKVFIDIMLHMCNKGRENLREMVKDDFEIKTDATQQCYVCKTRDRLTKNHRTDDDSHGGRMYATPDNPQRCPVLSFEN